MVWRPSKKVCWLCKAFQQIFAFIFIYFSSCYCVSIPYIQWMCSRLFISLSVSPNVFNVKCLIVDCRLLIRAFVTTHKCICVYTNVILMFRILHQQNHTNMWVIWHWIFLFRLRINLFFIMSTIATTSTTATTTSTISATASNEMSEQTRTLIC